MYYVPARKWWSIPEQKNHDILKAKGEHSSVRYMWEYTIKKGSVRSKSDGTRTRFSEYKLDFLNMTHDNINSEQPPRQFRVVWFGKPPRHEAVDSQAAICGFGLGVTPGQVLT